jgi:hypothetical protein
MNVCYSFIGPLPSYSIEQAHQLRLFYNGPAYFILNDYNNPNVTLLRDKYNINIIRYDDVIHTDFIKLIGKTKHKFYILHNSKGRENLFIYSFERFYVLYNLMIKYSLNNVLFIELDNLVYDDPRKWLSAVKDVDMAYLFDNNDRASAGISFIQNHKVLLKMLEYFNIYIENDTGFINEMSAMARFYQYMEKKGGGTFNVSFLPIHWNDPTKPPQSYALSNMFADSIFDAAAIGVYLAGGDTHHTGGKIILGKKNQWSLIDYTNYKFIYIKDEEDRKIPYIVKDSSHIRINNLHIHSKDLINHLSKPL